MTADPVPLTCINLQSLCLWNGSDFGGNDVLYLFKSDGFLPAGIVSNEQSGANELSGSARYARLYYGANSTGAWVCLDPGTSFPNFVNLHFNNGNGRPGFGESIENNIASVGIDSNACSNPL